MANVCQGSEILAAIQMVQAKASMKVRNATGNPFTSEETLSSLDFIAPDLGPTTLRGAEQDFESLLFGYNLTDIQSFWEGDSLGLELGPWISIHFKKWVTYTKF